MTPKTGKISLSALAAAASAGIAFGCMGTISQVITRQGFALTEIVTTQFIIATVLLGILVAIRFRQLPPWRDTIKLLAVGLLQPLSALLLYSGISYLSVGQAVAIQFQYVWLAILIQSVVERTLPSKNMVIAALTIIVGTLLASGVAEELIGGGSTSSTEGILLSAACAITYAFFLYLNGKVALDTHPIPRSFVLCLSGAILTSVAFPGVYTSSFETLLNLTPGAFTLGVLTIAPVLCLSFAAKRLPGGVVAILTSMELPAAVVTGALILGDPTSPVRIIGVVIILLGIVISEIRHPNNHPPPPPTGLPNEAAHDCAAKNM